MQPKINCDEFSKMIELIKKAYKYDTLQEAIIHVINEHENGYVKKPFLSYGNVNQFINKTLRDKMRIEYEDRNMIKEEYMNKNKNKLF